MHFLNGLFQPFDAAADVVFAESKPKRRRPSFLATTSVVGAAGERVNDEFSGVRAGPDDPARSCSGIWQP